MQLWLLLLGKYDCDSITRWNEKNFRFSGPMSALQLSKCSASAFNGYLLIANWLDAVRIFKRCEKFLCNEKMQRDKDAENWITFIWPFDLDSHSLCQELKKMLNEFAFAAKMESSCMLYFFLAIIEN